MNDPLQEEMLKISTVVSNGIDFPGRMIPIEVAALAGMLGVLAVIRIRGLNEEAIIREAQRGAPTIDATGRVTVIKDGKRIVAGRMDKGKIHGLPGPEDKDS